MAKLRDGMKYSRKRFSIIENHRINQIKFLGFYRMYFPTGLASMFGDTIGRRRVNVSSLHIIEWGPIDLRDAKTSFVPELTQRIAANAVALDAHRMPLSRKSNVRQRFVIRRAKLICQE